MFGWFKKKTPPPSETHETAKPVEDYTSVEPLLEYFKGETGIDFDAKKEIIRKKLVLFCRERKIYDFDSLHATLQRDGALKQELIDYLTVNETYFYREIAQINKVVDMVRASQQKVEILCAPSSTGEEPYTIVMMLLEAGIAPERFHILGIDINSEAVEKSVRALYRERSLHRLPESMATRYFTKTEAGYELSEQVKRCVSFRRINIFDDAFLQLGRFDVVFSRNMLIYFDKATKKAAKERLERLLRDEKSAIFFGHADLGGLH